MAFGRVLVAVFSFSLIFAGCSGDIKNEIARRLPGVREAEKPFESGGGKRAMEQAPVPAGWVERPFIEENPAPELREGEKRRGYMIFSRPLPEPVYPNTLPMGYERIDYVTGFSTPGELTALSFSVLPSEKLEDFRVRLSPLKSGDSEIPASCLSSGLVTYWNDRFFTHRENKFYRRVPKLIENVDIHTSPAGECQRYVVLVRVPPEAKAGLYEGDVILTHKGYGKAVIIPVLFRVLDFKLEKDPDVWMGDMSAQTVTDMIIDAYCPFPEGSSEAAGWIKEAEENNERAMREYGFDGFPMIRVIYDADRNRLEVTEDRREIVREKAAAGARGPVPFAMWGAWKTILRDVATGSPEGSDLKSWDYDPRAKTYKEYPVTEEYYREVTRLVKELDGRLTAEGFPERVYAGGDEIDVRATEFGVKFYEALKKAGVRAWATRGMHYSDRGGAYNNVIDVFCSYAFDTPYAQASGDREHEHWVYHNDVAYQQRRPRIMNRGGRMTFGYGFWRSGYGALFPWAAWQLIRRNNPFNYLARGTPPEGNHFDRDGSLIMALHWENIREGRVDAKYIYTLQKAIAQREGCGDADCRRLVEEGKALLRETWEMIPRSWEYLDMNIWPSREFNARRWRMAQIISALLKYPPVNPNAPVPSVMVADVEDKHPEITSSPPEYFKGADSRPFELSRDNRETEEQVSVGWRSR